jgi:hypothetical protein
MFTPTKSASPNGAPLSNIRSCLESSHLQQNRNLRASGSGVTMTGDVALFFTGGEEGKEPAFSSVDSVVVDSVDSVEVVKNKIASNLSLRRC